MIPIECFWGPHSYADRSGEIHCPVGHFHSPSHIFKIVLGSLITYWAVMLDFIENISIASSTIIFVQHFIILMLYQTFVLRQGSIGALPSVNSPF